MKPTFGQRKILVIEHEPTLRNLIRILLTSMGCECTLADGGLSALGMLSQKTFDAVLLDLRLPDLPPIRVLSGIKTIQPTLVGRVLVINSEVANSGTMEAIERFCLPNISRNRLVQELWPKLEHMFRIFPLSKGAT